MGIEFRDEIVPFRKVFRRSKCFFAVQRLPRTNRLNNHFGTKISWFGTMDASGSSNIDTQSEIQKVAQQHAKLSENQPSREILCRDSISWMNELEDGFPAGYCGFTSLPDISELQSMFGVGQFEEYKEWFEDTAALFMSKLPEKSYVIFLQSDIRVVVDNHVHQWIDKSHLCSKAADRSGFTMMWHKLVCLNDNLTKRSAARPTYSHLICYAKRPTTVSNSYLNAMQDVRTSLDKPKDSKHERSSSTGSPPRIKIKEETAAGKYKKKSKDKAFEEPKVTYRTGLFAVPDIFYRGEMVWSKGIGLDCCYIGTAFLKEVAKATCIVDPFAGQGTVLAMANALGVNAIGVELSSKRCRKAKTLNLQDKLHLVSSTLRNISLELIHEREAERSARAKYDKLRDKIENSELLVNQDDSSVDGSVDLKAALEDLKNKQVDNVKDEIALDSVAVDILETN